NKRLILEFFKLPVPPIPNSIPSFKDTIKVKHPSPRSHIDYINLRLIDTSSSSKQQVEYQPPHQEHRILFEDSKPDDKSPKYWHPQNHLYMNCNSLLMLLNGFSVTSLAQIVKEYISSFYKCNLGPFSDQN
ncbi:unnamed protein product, partial [Meganyctiphanes norvegica]